MQRSIPRLLARYVLLSAAIVVLNFLLPRLLPGNPLTASRTGGLDIAAPLTPATQQKLDDYYQLNQPLGKQFDIYLRDLFHGNLGWSISHSHPVSQLIVQRVPWTLGLMLSSLLLASLFGTVIGVAASWYPDRPAERLTVSGAALLSAIPEFLIAILLLLIFSIGLNWLPLGGGRTVFQPTGGGIGGPLERANDIARHMLLPVLALSIAGAAGFVLFARDATRGMRGSAWLALARAKGLSERQVALRHLLPNIALPLLTFFGLRLGAIFGGALVIERVFNIPGLGLLAFQAVQTRDYPVLQAVFLLSGLGVLLGNLCLDLITLRADRRGQSAHV